MHSGDCAVSIISPSFIKNTVAVRRSRSKMSCVATSTVYPRCARALISCAMYCFRSGSSAEVGSSRHKIFGSCASTRTRATRCFCPPERASGYWFACASSWYSRNSFCVRSSAWSGDNFVLPLVRQKIILSRTVMFSNK